jgi:AraC family transcriptional regulator
MTLRFASGEFYGCDAVRREHGGFGFASLAAAGRETDVQEHTHDTAHFVLVLAGGYISTARGAPEVACAPTLVFNPAGVKHRDRFVNGRGRFVTLTVAEAANDVDDAGVRMGEEAAVLLDPRAFRAAQVIARELATTAPSTLVLESSAWTLTAEADPDAPRDRAPPPWLKTAQEMIRETRDRTLSVGAVAAAVGVHRVHLARAFDQWFGCSPGEFLRGRRLERAAALVGRDAAPLAAVAAETGYVDQAHMTHAFRAAFGATPGDLRRDHVSPIQSDPRARA